MVSTTQTRPSTWPVASAGPARAVWQVLDGIAQGQVYPHYQPIVSLQDGELLGVEALARWERKHNDELIPATSFVPVLERARRVTDLTAFMLDQACADLARWQRLFHLSAAFRVSVNVSATELVDRRLVGLVAETVRFHRIVPGSLCLEVTETAAIDNFEVAKGVLAELTHGIGVRLAVDDYGAGFTHGRYLSTFPIDTLKIDQAVIGRMAHRAEDSAFVRSTVDYASFRELKVIAEGVETPSQAQILRRMGCTAGQGFHIGVPSPAHEVLGRWLQPCLAVVDPRFRPRTVTPN